MVIVKSIQKYGSVWLIAYTEPLACGCGFTPRKTIQIAQTNKPTTKQIQNAIDKDK